MHTTFVAGLKALISTIALLSCYYLLAYLLAYDGRGAVVLGSALFMFFCFFLHYTPKAEEKSGQDSEKSIHKR